MIKRPFDVAGTGRVRVFSLFDRRDKAIAGSDGSMNVYEQRVDAIVFSR
jgi:hypothetical protein